MGWITRKMRDKTHATGFGVETGVNQSPLNPSVADEVPVRTTALIQGRGSGGERNLTGIPLRGVYGRMTATIHTQLYDLLEVEIHSRKTPPRTGDVNRELQACKKVVKNEKRPVSNRKTNSCRASVEESAAGK
jgi:hypothetical protein